MSRGEEVGGPGVIVRTCRFRTAVGGRSKLASEAAAAAGWGIGMAAVTGRRPSTPVHVRYVGGLVDRTQDGAGDSHDEAYTRSMAPPTITEAVVLRAFAFGEADRVLHVYTQASGRVGVVAKGVRRTKSRFGGRLEPFSHVELSIHRGRGELGTVTGASLIRSHDAVRRDPYRLQVGLVGLEAMLKLFTEEEHNDRAFLALTRFLDALDVRDPQPGRPALDPLVLSFQLKLLWLSGFLPHLGSCVECGAETGLVAFHPASGGAVCASCDGGGIGLSPDGLGALAALLGAPIADAPSVGLGDRAARDVLAVVTSSYEHHGGFRLRTLSA